MSDMMYLSIGLAAGLIIFGCIFVGFYASKKNVKAEKVKKDGILLVSKTLKMKAVVASEEYVVERVHNYISGETFWEVSRGGMKIDAESINLIVELIGEKVKDLQ